MKVNYITLGGVDYPMCFSLTASEELSDAFGGLDNISKALGDKDIGNLARAVNTILIILIKAGRTYVEMTGGKTPPELKCKPADLIDVRDPSAVESIFAAISADNSREVEVQLKNAETTQGA